MLLLYPIAFLYRIQKRPKVTLDTRRATIWSAFRTEITARVWTF